MRVYQPTVLNTLAPYAGPQGFGMNRFTGQTIAQQTTAGSNQIDPVPFRGYSVPAPSLAYYGLSEKKKRPFLETVLMLTQPHYGVMRLLQEKNENERYQIVYRQMVTDIRNDWTRTGGKGDILTTKDPVSDEFMETATVGRINFWVPKLSTGNAGGKRVAARHIRAAEAIAREWTPRSMPAPPPPPPMLPMIPGTDTAGTTTTPGTAPQAPSAPGSILPTTGFFSKPLNLALIAAGVFLVAKQFKIV
jgi:hypothetical protein